MLNRLNLKKRHWAALLCLIGTVSAWWCWLPDKIFNVPYSAVLLSAQNELLDARIAADQQWRFPPRTQVPEKFKTALITFEDKRFYTHWGVDPIAILRAIKSNLVSNKRVSGASTLSMQTIRLARNHQTRTYVEKIKEMLLALRLEMGYDKQEIMALYSAHAPFGGNVVGLEAAAWRYFGRPPAQLSWAESAMLAVLPNNPAMIHLKKNRDQLKRKRDRLLKRLADNQSLSMLDYQLAVAEPLPVQKRAMPSLAPHLVETLKAQYPSGFFASTLDRTLQRQTGQTVMRYSQQLQQKNIAHAAALVIDNQDLSVKAYIGNSQFNHRFQSGYAIDLIHRPRSSGSLFKPLLFAAMLEQGDIISSTLIPDLPTQYSGYAPQNYDRSFRGAVPAKFALAQSLNVPAVRLLRQYGVDKFYDFLQQAGVTSLHRTPDEYGLPLILGGAETTLWDMAQIYANLASLSRQPGQQNYKPVTLLQRPTKRSLGRAEISQASAWLTLEALLEVSRPGSENHWKNFQSSQKIAWKTGTSYGLKDGWAIGVTPRWTVAVWVGNANGQGVPALTGVGAAAPLMFAIFNQLDKSPWFETPFHDLKEVFVCRDNGFLSNGRCEAQVELIARNSHFDRLTPHHQLIHLDKSTGERVHSECENVSQMIATTQFVLPPAQEYYYQRLNSGYKAMPEFRENCLVLAASKEHAPMAFLYPGEGTQVYIPRNLDGSLSQVIFEAVHRNNNAQIFWHLDDHYIGRTKNFHQQSLSIDAGWHQLTIVDHHGFRLTRRFKVLGE